MSTATLKKKRRSPTPTDVLTAARAVTSVEQVPVEDLTADLCNDCGVRLVGLYAWWDTPVNTKRLWEAAGLKAMARGADIDDPICSSCKTARLAAARAGEWEWALGVAREANGAMPANKRWTASALCAQADPEAWFPEAGCPAPKVVQETCMSCPVRAECLMAAVANREQYGMWAGFGRAALRALYAELGLEDDLLPVDADEAGRTVDVPEPDEWDWPEAAELDWPEAA